MSSGFWQKAHPGVLCIGISWFISLFREDIYLALGANVWRPRFLFENLWLVSILYQF